MKKLYLLLLAFVAMVTTANAGVINLVSQDYESGDVASWGWTSPNLAGGMAIAGDDFGKFFQFSLGSNNGRSCYVLWGESVFADNIPEAKYHIEFEWCYATAANNQFGTEFALFSGEKPKQNNGVNHDKDNTLFSITESADNHNLFFINGDTQNTMAVETGAWYSIFIDVDTIARTVDYKITSQIDATDVKAEGTRTFSEGTNMLASGLNIYAARYSSVLQLDNLKVQVITEQDFANVPSVALTGVNGTERTYTIAFLEGETLHVKGTNGQEQELEYSDCDGSYQYTTSTSGTIEVWTTSGEATSEKVTAEVECVLFQLPAAVATITNASKGFAKEYTITVDNSEVPTKPQIFIAYEFKSGDKVIQKAEDQLNGVKVNVEDKGILTIQTIAPGFGTTIVNVENNQAFAIKNDIDFQHMTGAELTEKGFEAMEDLDSETTSGETNWTGRMRMYYQVDSGEKDDDQNTIWTNVPVYGPTTQNYEAIKRYQYLQSKLNEETAATLFAPMYLWHDSVNVSPSITKYYENGQPKTDHLNHVGGSTNVKMYEGIGMCFSGNLGDGGDFYINESMTYAAIVINNVTMGVDGLTDEDFIIVSKIDNYGGGSIHPQFPIGTEPEAAIAAYKAAHLGGVNEVHTGLETFQLYRVDTALSRVLVLTPDNNPAGIDEMNYNKVVSDHNAPVYNMNGVRMNMNSLNKGVYVKQGKKFVIK